MVSTEKKELVDLHLNDANVAVIWRDVAHQGEPIAALVHEGELAILYKEPVQTTVEAVKNSTLLTLNGDLRPDLIAPDSKMQSVFFVNNHRLTHIDVSTGQKTILDDGVARSCERFNGARVWTARDEKTVEVALRRILPMDVKRVLFPQPH